MKKLLPISSIIILTLLNCCVKQQRLVKIKVKESEQKGKDLKITVFQNLDELTLANSTIDSAGNATLEFELPKATFATIQLGEKYSEVYLLPGFEMTASTNEINRSISFTGKGAEVNNYLSAIFLMAENIKMADGKYIGSLELDDFLNRFDSLLEATSIFHKRYTDSVALSTEVKDLLEKKSKIKLLTIKQEYAFSMYNNYLSENRDVLQSGKNIIAYKMPVGFENVIQEVPLDTAILNLGMFEYTYLCQLYLYNSVYSPNACVGTKSATTPSAEVKSDNDIKQRTYPDGFQEYLLAKNIQYWLTMLGITPGIDSIFSDYKQEFKESVYLPLLQKNYNEWVAIATGSPAPDFSGTTLEGKNVSLSDFKSKIVFVDVWATWCGPCIEEIPYSKKLQASFVGNNKVEFLNVSIDQDIDAWKKFLLEDKAWTGTHINQQGEQIDSFLKAYKIAGFPTYILIDLNGTIVDAKASRPSEGKIKKQIESLLDNNL